MQKYRIILIEDSELDAELLKRHLIQNSGFGVEILRLETPWEFDEALKESWDAIISDYNVPGFGALAALKALKSKALDIPLVVVSGEVGEENAVDMMHSGAEDFIRKSNLARLGPALERSINVSQMRKRKARLRAEHEKALRDRERLMDIVCHDLKNPLSSVRLGCQVVLAKCKDQTSLDAKWTMDIVEGMLHSTERIDRLVADLLDQSKIEAGLFRVRETKQSVKKFLEEIIKSFKPIAQSKGMKLILKEFHSDADFYFDHDRIFQVLGNLVNNALKFSPAGEEITVGAEHEGTELRFFVKDRGPGIIEEERHLVFSRGFQGKQNKYKGNGLGLWIAREIAKAHAGDLSFVCEASRKETIFWVKLPNAFKLIEDKKIPLNFQEVCISKILLVDDDEDLSQTICRILSEKNVTCRTAENFDRAVQLLQEHAWEPKDIILIDYDLPGKNGGDLIQWIRSHFGANPLPRLVLMSAHPDIDERAQDLKVFHYIRKPMNLHEVFDLLS